MRKIGGMFVLAVVSVTCASAQLCPGGLGDPIVNVTFGAGTNPGPRLLAASTTYQYAANDCPNDGFYALRNNTSVCFSATWHTLNADHTGDPNGYFMLVNASFQPSAFYVDTVRGLCSGTTYEFAVWVVNVLGPSACSGNGNQPNLTFTIEKTDGTIVQTFDSGNIPTTVSPVWKQFGFFFSTPSNVTEVVVRIFNNAPGGCGNDLALDDITFRPCGPLIQASILGEPADSIAICEGNAAAYTFDATLSAGYINPSFQWQQQINGGAWSDIPGAITTTLSRNFPATTTPGLYAFRFTAAEAGNLSSMQCRVASDPLIINIVANPTTSVTANSPVCEKSTLQLTAGGGSVYQWSGPGNFSAATGSVSVAGTIVQQSGKYYVLVINSSGCNTLDSIDVLIHPSPVAATNFPLISICQGETVQLQSSGGMSYEWNPVSGLSSSVIPDPLASPRDTITYQVIVSNQFNCKDTAQVLINVIQLPEANAGPDKMIVKGNAVQLGGSISGQNLNFSWSPGLFISSTSDLQPMVSPPVDTTYILTVESRDGCGTDYDTVKVIVYRDVFVPSAFTPNNDGLNDTWFIPALSAYAAFTLTVYNRYGQIVFQNRNINRSWDGKFNGESLPIGVYVYVLDLLQGKRLLKGTVSIIR